MFLKFLGSSSSGNSYLLHNDTECLVVDAGISLKEAKKALGFDISKIVGLLITHEHFDHSKYIKDYISAGIDVYSAKETFDVLKISSHRTHPVYELQYFFVGNFKVMPFKVKHDCVCPYGYLINHSETGTILSLTDTWYCPYKLKGLNQVICEANYSEDILQANVESGLVHPSVANRSKENHMSLEILKDLLRANDLTQVNNIVLIHLSAQNSDGKRFQKEIHELTGKTVTVAEKGVEINFYKTPF